MAWAKSKLISPRILLAAPTSRHIAEMQARSTTQARKRVTGPASSSEKAIPSGVRMSKVLVLPLRMEWLRQFRAFCPRLREEQGQHHQLDEAEGDFAPVGDDRLVILREECLHEAGPHQQ